MVDGNNPELTQVEVTRMWVYFTIDENNYITSWGTSSNPQEDEEYALELPVEHAIFLLANYRVFEYTGDDLVYNEERALMFLKKSALSRIKDSSEYTDTNVIYDNVRYPYTTEAKTTYQKVFNDYILLGTDDPIKLKGTTLAGEPVETSFSKIEFCTFFAYCTAYISYKENLVESYYAPLVEACTTEDELDEIKWDNSPKEGFPLPDKPTIDLNNDGNVSQAELEALKKENKELHDRVDFNERALMDTIAMFATSLSSKPTI